MKKPILVINLKTYKQGKEVIDLVKKIEKFYIKNSEKVKEIILGVQISDISKVKKILNKNIKIYAQHIDPFQPGRHTGYILAEAVKSNGADGSFINHSEHQVSFNKIKEILDSCKSSGISPLLFAPNSGKAKKFENLLSQGNIKKGIIAVEPPELVAGDKSVSEKKPEFIKKISKKLEKSFLVGAGIKNKEDVKKALELGAEGIAISSAVCKAKNPEKVLEDLLDF